MGAQAGLFFCLWFMESRSVDMDDAARDVAAAPSVIDAVRRAAHTSQSTFADNDCIHRFLRAYDGDTEKAAAALSRTLLWRLEKQPWTLECTTCLNEPLSHNLRVVGIDKEGRPVTYTCFGQALYRFDPDAINLHLTRTMEDAFAASTAREARGAPASESCVWVVDMFGFSLLKDSNPRTCLLAAQLLDHYPERLGRCVIIDAPSIFSGTWNTLKRVVNEHTVSKVCFVRSTDGTLETELDTFCDHSLSKWLASEVAENRLKENQDGAKQYWRINDQRGRDAPHDARACPDFLGSQEYDVTFTSRLASGQSPQKDTVQPVDKHIHDVVVEPDLPFWLAWMIASMLWAVGWRSGSWMLLCVGFLFLGGSAHDVMRKHCCVPRPVTVANCSSPVLMTVAPTGRPSSPEFRSLASVEGERPGRSGCCFLGGCFSR